MRRTSIAIGVASVAALGAVAGTIWVGASVREDTVVARPYEDGLRHDAERRARAALGLEVSLPGAIEAGAAPLAFALRDREGRPLDDGAVTISIARTETSRGGRSAEARPAGGGRWAADLAFPEPGAWDVRFDVARGEDRVRLERRVAVRAACDLSAGACARALEGGGEVTLELSPRPIAVMKELGVRVTIRPTSTPTSTPTPTPPPAPTSTSTSTVTVSFSMPGMTMGENRVTLVRTAAGAYEGKAVLVRCPSGRRDWAVDVEVREPGATPRTARFPLTAAEGGR